MIYLSSHLNLCDKLESWQNINMGEDSRYTFKKK